MSCLRIVVLGLTALLCLAAPAVAVPPAVIPAPASWGQADAPVSLVVFQDLECPYCGRLHGSLDALRQRYGADKLRVELRHFPLDFHQGARTKARVASAILAQHGAAAFERFVAELFRSRGTWQEAATAGGLPTEPLEKALENGGFDAEVAADLELGKAAGVSGTPTSFVNGIRLVGAQPESAFVQAIDAQLAAADKLRAEGVPAARLSAELTQRNLAARPADPPPKPAQPPPDPHADQVFRVPVDSSPQLGPADALVTVVVFSEFQCPFCARLLPTLTALRERYGKDLRLVFKHNPLSFHPRAEPAAQLAAEAHARQGAAGFWRAHDLLFANQQALADEDLARYATQLGLEPATTLAAVRDRKHAKAIEADQALADDVEARGTPISFVNGRRLAGAQPLEAFTALIDAERVKAKALRRKGVAGKKLYDRIIAAGRAGPVLERKQVPAPTADQPALGGPMAKVTVQVFADLQCPFTLRFFGEMARLRATYGGAVRFVFRHRPLSFHQNAPMLHNAAVEALHQQGDQGFWQLVGRLAEAGTQVDRARLDELAAELGLDLDALAQAIDEGSHQAVVDADVALADAAGIRATPGILINDVFVAGLQPAKYKRIIELGLAGKL